MRLLPLQLLTLACAATGFTVPASLTPTRSLQRPKQSKGPFDSSTTSSSPTGATRKSTTSLFVVNPILFGPELIGPVLLFLGSISATILASQDEDVTVADYIKRATSEIKEATPAPAPAPAPETIVEKALPTPEPLPSPSLVVTPPAPAPPAPAPAVDEPRFPSATTASNSDVKDTDAGDSIAELRRGVAKKRDSDSAVPSTQLLQRSSTTEEKEDDEKKLIKNLTHKDGKAVKKRGFFRKVWRVIKKIVAPWRKWKNIS